jgi:hypothetical protein
MTSSLEQHMEYLNSQLEHIYNLVDDKFVNISTCPNMIDYLKQEKY